MYFEDRNDAARQLAQAVRGYRGQDALVLAIPRGAVAMGRVLADALGGDLDVVLAAKLHAPGSPELAMGAVDETGWTRIADDARDMGVADECLEEEKRDQLAVLKERRRLYTPWRRPIDIAGRLVIVVDDGLATIDTMIAALRSVRARAPRRLVCAVPVASREAIERIRSLADEVACLETPAGFRAATRMYRRFELVGDIEVIATLRKASRRRVAA